MTLPPSQQESEETMPNPGLQKVRGDQGKDAEREGRNGPGTETEMFRDIEDTRKGNLRVSGIRRR